MIPSNCQNKKSEYKKIGTEWTLRR